MTQELIIQVISNAFFTSFLIMLPALLTALLVGILISIFQAATSIQEMTLTFVPKIVITAIVLVFMLPWMMDKMIVFTKEIFNIIVTAPK
ncbi:MAG TPA: flagellar biosynthesis protein FliQ [Ignavibacteriales bacterium]|jgi:flagellar biosynthetic protein FliQ|nr:flagellar biosynthesis protein FliQ [Ignavibacteriales bacterium]